MKYYSYTRERSSGGERPTYTFIEVEGGVKVIRNNNDEKFEHTFLIGDKVQNRTLNKFHWHEEENISVYASSEEINNSNSQSLAKQIDFMYFKDSLIDSESDYESSNDITETLVEGTKVSVLVNKFERNSKARKLAIEHHQCKCSVCEFDFKKVYGKLGVGFIHVHHIFPLCEVNAEYKVNPLTDLIPVCPNCHAMLHRTKKPPSIDTLKEIIREHRD